MARFSALLLALLSTQASLVWSTESLGKASRQHVPGAYIFEFEDGKDTAGVLRTIGNEGTTRMNLDYKLFKGVSVQLDDVENAEETAFKIASSPSVKNVWPVEVYSIPKPKVNWVGTPDSSRAAGGLSKRSNETEGYAPHKMTQIDELHKKGFTGKGVKIAVIDTGIDYKHPDLGGCFGEGCLTTFGTDLVGDDYDGFNTPKPDEDPMDCQGHGTHVAGIIAAQKNNYGFLGGAPDATIGAYRVFGCDGQAGNDVLIAAFNQAFEDGADIITASIGGPSGWADEPWSRAVSAIVEQGVPCTVSAGNDGALGLFFGSAAAGGRGVAVIASFDNAVSPTLLSLSEFTVDGGKAQEFGYTAALPTTWDGVELPLWAPDLDTTIPDGGCEPYPADTPDLSEHIVLIRRGTCTYVQKAENAAKFGAKYIVIYNNKPGTVEYDVSSVPGIKAAAMVTPEVGQRWIKLLKDGSDVTLSVTGPETAETQLISPVNKVTGGALSDYTSWGPSWDLEEIKPSFGAPGGNILSTYPTAKGGYAVLSGTSMACPLVAAAYALVSQVRGTLDPREILHVLSADGNPQVFNDGAAFYEDFAPVPQQGGGLMQVSDAAYATTLLEPASLSFGDTATFHDVLNFTLTNAGDEEVSYDISHVPALSMYTLEADSIYPAQFPNEPIDGATARLSFSESKISVAAGESVFVEVMPRAPSGLNAKRLPVWSGWVAVNGSDGSSLSVPYQGVTGNLYEHKVIAADSAWVSRADDDTLRPVPVNTTFTLPVPGSEEAQGTILPAVVAYLALGSTTVRADIVPLTTTKDTPRTTDFFGTKTIGQPDGFPLRYVGRRINSGPWNGKLDSGNFAPPGTYKFVVRALRIRGDPRKEDDWDVAESGAFTIKYE